MYCLRCGRESRNEQVFCDSCLQIMEQRPVKPGTAVQLPEKTAVYATRQAPPLRRALSPGEQVQKLRGTLRWLSAAVLALSVVLMLTAAMLVYTLANQPDVSSARNWGRNYTSTGSTQP